MHKLNKVVGIAFKVMVALYVLVIASQKEFRPDIYKIVRMSAEVCVGILLLYILGKWTLIKLGLFQEGSVKISRKASVKTLGAAAVLILLCIGTEYFYHDCSLTYLAIRDLQTSKDAKAILGTEIRTGWFITGEIHMKGPDGMASFSIPVKGSKAAAELKVKGIREDGSWRVAELYLIADSNKVQIAH